MSAADTPQAMVPYKVFDESKPLAGLRPKEPRTNP
jgi:hypothetical protein